MICLWAVRINDNSVNEVNKLVVVVGWLGLRSRFQGEADSFISSRLDSNRAETRSMHSGYERGYSTYGRPETSPHPENLRTAKESRSVENITICVSIRPSGNGAE